LSTGNRGDGVGGLTLHHDGSENSRLRIVLSRHRALAPANSSAVKRRIIELPSKTNGFETEHARTGNTCAKLSPPLFVLLLFFSYCNLQKY
jgi:hypothetical protein